MSCALKEISTNFLPVIRDLVNKTNCSANICFNQGKIEVNLIWPKKHMRIADYSNIVVIRRLNMLLSVI